MFFSGIVNVAVIASQTIIMKKLFATILHTNPQNSNTLDLILNIDTLRSIVNYSFLLVFIIITVVIYKNTHYQKETLLYTLNKHKWLFTTITSVYILFFSFIHLLSNLN
jgi:NADH:ubiquinone oxidoreductase subunit 6 (subunit J)